MKNFKNLLCIIAMLLIGFTGLAQNSPFRFGAKAGLNLSNATVEEATDTKMRTGFHVAGLVEYALPKNFLIQSGLSFTTKGSKIEQLNGDNWIPKAPDYTHTFNEYYLQLPLYGAYRMNISTDFNMVLGVGPYFAYGIGGKTKQKFDDREYEWDTFGDGAYDEYSPYARGETLNRFDMGLGVGLDVEYHKCFMSLGYEHGLSDISANQSNFKYRNYDFTFSVGYKF